MALRLLIAAAVGVLATLLLFFLMQALVSREGAPPDAASRRASVDVVRVPPEPEEPSRQRRTLPEPPPQQQTPPSLQVPAERVDGVASGPLSLAPPQMELPAGSAGSPSLGQVEAGQIDAAGDAVPLVQFPPLYPREARLRGTEGWVRIRFVIEADGSVSNAMVVEAEPRRVFDREALQAIQRWKYRPRMVGGQPVPRDAEQVIEFRLDGN